MAANTSRRNSQGSSPPTRRTRSRDALTPIVLLVWGCGKLAGLDDYGFGEDTVRDECGALEAPGQTGCEPVGVPPSGCGAGFEPDGEGGCRPLLPPTPCESTADAPRSAYPGRASCEGLGLCSSEWAGVGRTPVVYARPDGPVDADGSPGKPFPTIEAALRAEPAQILLGEGTFEENVLVDISVAINGLCPDKTRIRARDSARPAVSFLQGARGSEFRNVGITGGRAGVVIEEASLDLANLWIHDVGGPGVSVTGVPESETVTINSLLVERTAGEGIVFYGSSVRVLRSVVRDIGLSNAAPFLPGTGIAIRPSRFAPRAQPAPGPGWLPALALRSNVQLEQLLVERADDGIAVEGSVVHATAVAVRDTRRGAVAEWRPAGGLTGELELVASSIERSAELGVDVWNAFVTLERTTVRASGTDCAGAADENVDTPPGNAIRARYDRAAPPAEPPQKVRIAESLVDGSRQASVHVEGGSLELDRVLLRETRDEVCTNNFGYGAVIYGYERLPARALIRSTRISTAAAAGVAAFGANVTLDNARIGCAAPPSLGVEGSIQIQGDTLCGCGAAWRRCVPSREATLAPTMSSADCATGDAQDCAKYCLEDYFSPGTVLYQATVQVLGARRIAPDVSDASGCGALGSLHMDRAHELLVTQDGYVPAVGISVPRPSESQSPRARTPMLSEPGFSGFERWPAYGVDRIDLSTALFVGISVCDAAGRTDSRDTKSFAEVCPRGILGLTATLTPRAGIGPFYNDGSGQPNPTRTSAEGASIYWVNVPAGDYVIELHSPDGVELDCSADFFGQGESAQSLGGTRYAVRARAGLVVGAGFLYCSLRH